MPAWGAEVDIRSRDQDSLYLSHDPFAQGDDFDLWLAAFKSHGITGPLILNTKEDGLEAHCLDRLKAHGIENFFFLDTTIPTLVRWTTKKNVAHFAVRFSRYEPLSAVMAFAGKASWVWVDCFDGVPARPEDLVELKKAFRICVVSPELQVGVTPQQAQHIQRFWPLSPWIDAVCTKTPELWSPGALPSRAS